MNDSAKTCPDCATKPCDGARWFAALPPEDSSRQYVRAADVLWEITPSERPADVGRRSVEFVGEVARIEDAEGRVIWGIAKVIGEIPATAMSHAPASVRSLRTFEDVRPARIALANPAEIADATLKAIDEQRQRFDRTMDFRKNPLFEPTIGDMQPEIREFAASIRLALADAARSPAQDPQLISWLQSEVSMLAADQTLLEEQYQDLVRSYAGRQRRVADPDVYPLANRIQADSRFQALWGPQMSATEDYLEPSRWTHPDFALEEAVRRLRQSGLTDEAIVDALATDRRPLLAVEVERRIADSIRREANLENGRHSDVGFAYRQMRVLFDPRTYSGTDVHEEIEHWLMEAAERGIAAAHGPTKDCDLTIALAAEFRARSHVDSPLQPYWQMAAEAALTPASAERINAAVAESEARLTAAIDEFKRSLIDGDPAAVALSRQEERYRPLVRTYGLVQPRFPLVGDEPLWEAVVHAHETTGLTGERAARRLIASPETVKAVHRSWQAARQIVVAGYGGDEEETFDVTPGERKIEAARIAWLEAPPVDASVAAGSLLAVAAQIRAQETVNFDQSRKFLAGAAYIIRHNIMTSDGPEAEAWLKLYEALGVDPFAAEMPTTPVQVNGSVKPTSAPNQPSRGGRVRA